MINTKQELIDQLEPYKVVSFDIFDTLITRMVLSPSDIFYFVGEKVQSITNISALQYSKLRQQAEITVSKQNRNLYTLQDIYRELGKLTNIPSLDLSELLQIEKQFELEFCIPRTDMLEIFNLLKQKNTCINLISDMYLDSAFISQMLNKSGYSGWKELIVSCEHGGTKESGKLWEKYFTKYPDEQIHIGDNLYSDYKMPVNLGHKAIHISSPFELYVNSKANQTLDNYKDSNVLTKFTLGFFVNKVVFNSPFESELPSDLFGAAWLGPAFFSYIKHLTLNQRDSILLFCTREGYILLPLYEKYCKLFNLPELEHHLFYVSRRAITVASIKTVEDIYKIIKKQYKGTFGNFLRNKFNVEPHKQDNEMFIDLPRQSKEISDRIQQYIPDILSVSKELRTNYIHYLENLCTSSKTKIVIVDVGYSGTVQFYLSKILGKKIDGDYMLVSDTFYPKELDIKANGLILGENKGRCFYQNLLFLEWAMQVPYGQVKSIYFDEAHHVQAECMDDIIINSELAKMQEGYALFFDIIAGLQTILDISTYTLDDMFIESLFQLMIELKKIPESLVTSIMIQDDFSGNGTYHYNQSSFCLQSDTQKVPIFQCYLCKRKIFDKYTIKNTVKKYIPKHFYERAKAIWINYLK